MFSFPLHIRSHRVERLDVHFEGKWRKIDVINMDEDLADTPQKRSKLDAFFALVNKEKNELIKNSNFVAKAPYMLYGNIPKEYTWHGKEGEWKPKGRTTKKIGRIYYVKVEDKEKFYLRFSIIYVC